MPQSKAVLNTNNLYCDGCGGMSPQGPTGTNPAAAAAVQQDYRLLLDCLIKTLEAIKEILKLQSKLLVLVSACAISLVTV